MPILFALGWEHYAFTIPLSLVSIFLSLVVLVQRGRGGGLTGALGGMGGQSAFGAKAGDLFTRITVGVAAVWILLSMAALKMLNKTGMAVAKPPAAATAPTKGGTTTDTPATGGTKAGQEKPGTEKSATEKTGAEKGTTGKAATGTGSTGKTAAPATGTAPPTGTAPATGTSPPASTSPGPVTPDPAPAKSGDAPAPTKAPE